MARYRHQLCPRRKPGSAVSLQCSAPVGRPLATLRAEAVGLLYLLRRVNSHFEPAIPLLVFTDCLVLFQILQKWGRSDFWPDPHDIIHFDVIFPLIQELHQWTALLKLVKVKSHAGCQLNEMADALAEPRADQGCASDEELVLPWQQKYGFLLLRVRTSKRNLLNDENMRHRLPRDGAQNKHF